MDSNTNMNSTDASHEPSCKPRSHSTRNRGLSLSEAAEAIKWTGLTDAGLEEENRTNQPPTDVLDAKREITAEEEAGLDNGPFHWRSVARILISFLLSIMSVKLLGGLQTYCFVVLTGNDQHAGTLNSLSVGVGGLATAIYSNIAAQLMDRYGRRVMIIISAAKPIFVMLPLVASGIIVKMHDGGVYGEKFLDHEDEGDNSTHLKHLRICNGLFVAMITLQLATHSAEWMAAIGDVCRGPRHRSIGLGLFLASTNAPDISGIAGGKLSLLACALLGVFVGIASFVWSVIMVPETSIAVTRYHEAKALLRQRLVSAGDAATASTSTAESLLSVSGGPGKETASAKVQQQQQQPEQPEVDAFEVAEATIATHEALPMHLWVSPMTGLRFILSHSTSSAIALGTFCLFTFAIVAITDILTYYLKSRLDFSPMNLSVMGAEFAVFIILAPTLLLAVVRRYFRLGGFGAFFSTVLAASLLTFSFPGVVGASREKIWPVYAFSVPGIGLGSLLFPAFIAAISKGAQSPSDISLVMSSTMACYRGIIGVGSFMSAILFSTLPADKLFILPLTGATAAIASIFFCLVLYVIQLREERRSAAMSEAATEEATVAAMPRQEGGELGI